MNLLVWKGLDLASQALSRRCEHAQPDPSGCWAVQRCSQSCFLAGLQNVWKSLVSFVNPAFQPQQDLQLEEKEHIIFITQMAQACL